MFVLLKMFLVFLLVVILVAGFVVIGFVSNILKLFRKKDQRMNNAGGFDYGQQDTYSQGNDSFTRAQGGPSQRKKIIPQDEGEYVDFEEVE